MRILPKVLSQRSLETDFTGGVITSNGGVTLLRRADERLDLTRRVAACFTDHRRPELVVHEVETLVLQRLYGLALAYEDLNDHEDLRRDPALQAVAGRTTPRRGDCAPLAGKSTLNRLELAAAGRDDQKARKIVVDTRRLDELLVALCVESYATAPKEVVLDLDATDIPLHGDQEERFFHGYYREYCYMPLLFLIGRHPVLVRLRSAARDAAAGVEDDLGWLLDRLREAWPSTRIILRTDSGFCREAILSTCESRENVEYVIGLAKNPRLTREIAGEMAAAVLETKEHGTAARRFGEFRYATSESWSREQRVIGKAEGVRPGSPTVRSAPSARGGRSARRFSAASAVETLSPGAYSATLNTREDVGPAPVLPRVTWRSPLVMMSIPIRKSTSGPSSSSRTGIRHIAAPRAPFGSVARPSTRLRPFRL